MYLFSLPLSALCFKTTPANYFLQSPLRSFTRRTSRTFQSTASSALPSTIVEAFLLFSVCRIFLVSVACENCNWLRVCVQPAGHFRYFIRKVEKMALMDFFLSLSVVVLLRLLSWSSPPHPVARSPACLLLLQKVVQSYRCCFCCCSFALRALRSIALPACFFGISFFFF